MAFHAPVLLNYSHTKEWLDDSGGFNYKNVISMDVEYLITRGHAIPRKHLRGLIGTYQFVEYASLDYSRAVVDKNPEGSKWRVLNVQFPTSEEANESLIYRGKYIITYERLEDGDYSYVLNATDNADLKDALTNAVAMTGGDDIKYIEDISDSFSFDKGDDGSYEYNHELSITFGPHDLNAGENGPIIDYAKNVAEIILNNNLGNTFSGFLDAQAGASTDARWASINTKKYFTESYDLINGSCSFSKKFSTNQSASGNDYQYKLTHTFKRNTKGIIVIEEKGEVTGIKDGDVYNQAIAGVNNLIGGSYNRCVTVFNNYIDNLDTSSVQSLKDVALNISKDFNQGSAKSSYTISFSNDIKIDNGLMIERTMSIDRDSAGYVSIKENGNAHFMYKTKKFNFGWPAFAAGDHTYRSSTAWDMLNEATTGAIARADTVIKAYFDREKLGIHPAFYYVKDKDFTFKNSGKEVSWDKEYSTNPIHRITTIPNAGNAEITRVEITVNDTLPIPKHSTYPIPGWKELLHDSGQTGLGKRSVSIKAKRRRLSSTHSSAGSVRGKNILLEPVWPADIINYLFVLAKHEAMKLPAQIPQNYFSPTNMPFFLEGASCSFNSGGDLSVSCDMSYIARRKAQAFNVTSDYTEG